MPLHAFRRTTHTLSCFFLIWGLHKILNIHKGMLFFFDEFQACAALYFGPEESVFTATTETGAFETPCLDFFLIFPSIHENCRAAQSTTLTLTIELKRLPDESSKTGGLDFFHYFKVTAQTR